MKLRVTLTVVRDMEFDLNGVTAHEQGELMSVVRQSVLDDPVLFVDHEDSNLSCVVEGEIESE